MKDAALKPAIEAVLYAAAEPLSAERLAEAADCEPSDVAEALADLQAKYASGDSGLEIRQEDGGYRMATKPAHRQSVSRIVGRLDAQVSQSAMDALTLIAYAEPATEAEVSRARGVQSAAVLQGLLDRKLIRVCGRRDSPGRPLLYRTTKRFLALFGLNDLSELPKI